MSHLSEKRYFEILQELRPDDCTNSYCFFRQFLQTQHPDIRTLIQFKCIEKFKWVQSEKDGIDIGWNEAAMRWCMEGFAKKFAEVYDEDLTVKEIFKRTLEIEQK